MEALAFAFSLFWFICSRVSFGACQSLSSGLFSPQGLQAKMWGGAPLPASQGVLQRPVTWRCQVRSHPCGAGNLDASLAPALQASRRKQGKLGIAAASLRKVWLGATLPSHHSVRWTGALQKALGLVLGTTVHTLPSSTPLPLRCHLLFSKLNWVLAY